MFWVHYFSITCKQSRKQCKRWIIDGSKSRIILKMNLEKKVNESTLRYFVVKADARKTSPHPRIWSVSKDSGFFIRNYQLTARKISPKSKKSDVQLWKGWKSSSMVDES